MIKQLLMLAVMMMASLLMTVRGQQFELVKDINTGTITSGLNLDYGVSLNGLVFYREFSTQLSRTDGTEAGTFQLTDLVYSENNDLMGLVAGKNYVFFQAFYQNDYRLFRSDGTIAGTIPLHQTSSIYQSNPIDINGTVYFSSDTQFGTLELWKTDGTVAGTTLVKSLDNNPNDNEGITRTVNFNGVLYFMIERGFGPSSVIEWWKSDGTSAGTVPTLPFSRTFEPVAMGNYLYFAEDGALKRTNGTSITTVRQGFTSINGLSVLGNTLYFNANDGITGQELWKSDGTAAGTSLLKDINPDNTLTNFYLGLRASLNGILYFCSLTPGKGVEIWKTDGTSAGTVRVTDINDNPANSRILQILVVGNQIAFILDAADGQKLWKTNGTAAGTSQVTTFNVQRIYSIGSMAVFNGSTSNSYGLYRSDLTPAGTQLITQPTGLASRPSKITNANGTAFFVADDGVHGNELWKSDGTAAGTQLVKDLVPGSSSATLEFEATISNTVYFITNLNALWKSDGTDAGTFKLKDVSALPSGTNRIFGVTAVGNVIFFGVQNGFENSQLWKTDGTVAGTVLVKSFTETSEFSPISFKGNLYFGAYDGINSVELWKSDGTTAGTVVVKDAVTGNGYHMYNHEMAVNGNFLYYLTNDDNGFRLFRSDGTAAGTTEIKAFPLPGDQTASDLHSAGAFIYMTILDEGIERLWRSDGTNAGTIPLADFDEFEESASPYFRHWNEANGKLFFSPYDATQGDQLWVSDGTVAGTQQLTHIVKDPTLYTAQFSAVIGNIFYGTQFDPATGLELWRSDGTEAGTYIVQDYSSEPGESSFFTGMAAVNGTLFMGLAGELYKYKPSTVSTSAIRINAGGAAFTASGSRAFSADQYFSGSTNISIAASGNILNTADDQLYKEQRFGNSFSYAIPVKNGKAEVVLHFAEIYWGVPSRGGTTGSNKRKFNVDIEGSRKLTNYDIFAVAGGAMRAKTESFTVTVTDGMLNISFLSGTADKPIIAAIEVIPDNQYLLEPVADAYVRNTPYQETNYGKAATLEVKTGSLPAYQRETYLRFALNGVTQVSSAKLRIYGSNVQNTASTTLSVFGVEDDNWLETGIAWFNAPESTGSSLSSVNVNNTAKYYELDVTAYVKTQLSGNKAVSLLLTNPATQNVQLSFNSRENAANPPQLVIVSETSPAVRMAQQQEILQAETKPEASNISPNPAGKRFAVYVSAAHKGKIDLQLTNLSGNIAWAAKKQSIQPASKVEVDITSRQLPHGIYLVKVQSEALTETIKVLITE